MKTPKLVMQEGIWRDWRHSIASMIQITSIMAPRISFTSQCIPTQGSMDLMGLKRKDGVRAYQSHLSPFNLAIIARYAISLSMPFAPPRPCKHPGCGALSHQSYCATHYRKPKPYKQADAKRPSAYARGYTPRWQRYANQFLSSNPLCVLCPPGDRRPASAVDHIIPVSSGSDPIFWDATNHQPVCQSCHSRKTVDDRRKGLTRNQ